MKHLIKYTIILLTSLTSIFGFAQDPPPVIDLPTIVDKQTGEPIGGGTMIGDIISANGKILAYGADGISVFDATVADNTFLGKIPFDNTGVFFGKFNPIYGDGRLGSPDQSMMVYNPNNQYLYVITPKLKLLVINTTNIGQTWTCRIPVVTGDNPAVFLDQVLESQSSVVILKYDATNDRNRLYAHVSARDPSINCTGNFHTQKTLFGIYNVNRAIDPEQPGHIIGHYIELLDPDDNDVELGNHINNFVFNEDDENDYFHVVRLGIPEIDPDGDPIAIIETRDVLDPGFVSTVEFENEGGTSYFKIGKMLYVNDVTNDVHKIIVFPFTYFAGSISDPEFCVIDGDNPVNGTKKIVISPSKKILDAVYLADHQDLVLSYAPDNNELRPEYANTNIAIFRYNSTTETFDPFQSFDDNGSIPKTSYFDINASIKLTKLNESAVLIGKKDEIAKLEFNDDEGEYSYTTSIIEAENNFFVKGVISSGKTFIHNAVANGMEVIDNNNNYDHLSSLHTGYPVYDITANTDGSNLYFYNKLDAHGIGLYSYMTGTGDLVNINNDVNPENDIETAIGDVVYNPYQNHFLISKFEHGDAKILVLNASDNSFVREIDLTDAEYAKEMFISPNGHLYVCADMNNAPDHRPEVFVRDARSVNYNSLLTNPLEVDQFIFDFETYDAPFMYYSASFEYNPFNRMVYISMTIQDLKLLPYNSVANSIYLDEDGDGVLPPPLGKLLAIQDDLHTGFDKQYNLGSFPGKIICPSIENNTELSQFHGKLFITGKKFYEYDYLNPPSGDQLASSDQHYFIDMVYSPFHDKLFAIRETEDPNCSEHRKFELWDIFYSNGVLTFALHNNNGLVTDGQIASLFYNKYDRKLYVYQKIDAEKLGTTQVNLLSCDPADENPNWTFSEALGITSYFPEYDHTVDLAHYWFYNMTTPYINPSTQHIYLPNGGHSCVSKVPFVGNEAILLQNDDKNWAWLSFPRLQRTGGDPTVNAVIGGENIVPQGYVNSSKIENWPLKEQFIDYNEYLTSYEEWRPTGGLSDIKSEFGYKLNLLYNPEPAQNWVLLSGEVFDPAYEIDKLDARYENWVGYWLFEEQSPFDAITDEDLDKLTVIRAVDWCCYKQWDYFKDSQEPWWLCGLTGGFGASGTLNYGDMVILESSHDIADFQWLSSGNPPDKKTIPPVEYYQFEDQADYTAFFIELDSTENPQEIGAFIGDSCVGATSVLPEDTIVLVAGYIEGMSGEVTFEEYYGSEKSASPPIRGYIVRNNQSGNWEKRTVHTAEKQKHYRISFNQSNREDDLKMQQSLTIYPNPASEALQISYSLSSETIVAIQVLDNFGRQVADLLNTKQAEGAHQLQWNLKSSNGKKLPGGLYLLKLKAGQQIETKKVIVK